ncbi:hypothetical protein RUM43_012171 [Polyplax serrata]|uniref:Uncharacterized protein n=1 Tax=Polyplax serrata TaxID=468196 RepID=A0AAN8NK84_POLSC
MEAASRGGSLQLGKQGPPDKAAIIHEMYKSLPVHCIVETILSLEEQNDREKNNWRRKSNVEIDSYVIIPVNTPIQELVLVALTRLGYPKEAAASAKGAVLIRNWRALSFDTISPGPMVTVGELLGELSTIATLRIQILRPKSSLIQDIKDKLLRLLLIQSYNLLVRSGCPLDTLTLSNLCRDSGSTHHMEPSDDIRTKFEAWVSSQINNPYFHMLSPTVPNSVSQRMSSPRKESDAQQSMLQTQLTQKTRMRTSFDPELELPKLQKWFLENQHPSRQQIQQYVKELNNLESRRGRKPLDINNVVYWFKNARAAQKRAELRGFCTPLLNMNVNGFHGFHSSIRAHPPSLISSDQHSISEDEMSRLSDTEDNIRTIDINDNESDVPLSLTTTNNQRSFNECYEGERKVSPKEVRKEESIHVKEESVENLKLEAEKINSPILETSHESNGECKKENCVESGQNNGEKPDESPKMTEGGHLEPSSDPINNNNCSDQNFSDEEEDDDPNEDERSTIDLRSRKDSGDDLRSPSPTSGVLMPRLPPGFPLVPNSMVSQSIMYMSHYMPGLTPLGPGRDQSMLTLSQDERRKRNRTFIDPVTEVPRLEQWFSLNTHPSHNLILKYTDELNRMPYRQKFPRLEPKNVQFWFKNRRAKCKRLKMSLFENQGSHYQSN